MHAGQRDHHRRPASGSTSGPDHSGRNSVRRRGRMMPSLRTRSIRPPRRNWGLRGLGSGVRDMRGGSIVNSMCSDGDGQTVSLNFLHQTGGQTWWTTPVFTFREDPTCYATLTCGVEGQWGTDWEAKFYWGSGSNSRNGTITQTSPGIFTFLIEDIDMGDGCIYQLAGTFALADCQ